MIYRRKHCKFRIKTVHKKHIGDVLDCILHYHDWMFTDSSISRVEILPPTLDNINLMRNYNLLWVVKGFKNPTEFNIWNTLRFNQGFHAMMYASKSVGTDLIYQAINSMVNGQPLPSKREVDQSIEDNRLIKVEDEISEKLIREREKYRRLYMKFTVQLRREFHSLIKQHRVQLVDL